MHQDLSDMSILRTLRALRLHLGFKYSLRHNHSLALVAVAFAVRWDNRCDYHNNVAHAVVWIIIHGRTDTVAGIFSSTWKVPNSLRRHHVRDKQPCGLVYSTGG
jgi:hypothetical protein